MKSTQAFTVALMPSFNYHGPLKYQSWNLIAYSIFKLHLGVQV